MDHCLRRAIIYILFFLLSNAAVWAQADTAINEELAAFREADDLEGWIYHRIEYTDKKPAERLDFLMQTQRLAWRSYKTYSERTAWLYLIATQGYYQLHSGDILSSINSYENALQFYESYPLPDADVEEYVLKPLGNNYTRLADYNTALFIHRKSLDAAMKKGDGNLVASVYSNMAACARWKGDLQQAVDFCRQGISQVDKKKLLYGLLLSTYADVLAEQQRYDTAAVLSRQSLQILNRFGNDMQALYWYTSALQIASRIDMLTGAFAKARTDAYTALKLFDKYYPNARQREKAKLYVLLGDIDRATGSPDQAVSQYHEALMTLLPGNAIHKILHAIPRSEYLYSENTLVDALAGKAAAWETVGAKEDAFLNYRSFFAADNKLRSAFFYTESKYRELAINRSRVNSAMRLAYELSRSKSEAADSTTVLLIAEISKAQVLSDERGSRSMPAATDTLQRKLIRLQEAINYYQHELVYAADKQKVSMLLQAAEYELALLKKKNKRSSAQELLSEEKLKQILKALPKNVTILEFFEGVDSSYIIEADALGVQSIRCIGSVSNSIEQFMRQWFSSGAGAMLNSPKKFYDASYALYNGIFSDYVWKKERQYILIPDGKFSYLPFDALVTEANFQNQYKDWPWLFRKAVVSQAWSLQTWYEQQTIQYPQSHFAGFFVGSDRAGQQLKLSVEQEYKSIRQLVSGRYFLNADATWLQFNRAADSAGVLHIGSHAMSSAGDSLPFLQLYDKPFYLFDLRYKNFSPSLVVLGACKTASGQLLQGEGVNSLSRGFTAAGAGGVVSGLWNVNDETAIAFMQSFYQQLQHRDPAVALQKAKEKWLTDHADDPGLQLPYYWAGFVYSGHLQQVKLEAADISRWVVVAALIVLLFLAFLFRFIQSRRKRRL